MLPYCLRRDRCHVAIFLSMNVARPVTRGRREVREGGKEANFWSVAEGRSADYIHIPGGWDSMAACETGSCESCVAVEARDGWREGGGGGTPVSLRSAARTDEDEKATTPPTIPLGLSHQWGPRCSLVTWIVHGICQTHAHYARQVSTVDLERRLWQQPTTVPAAREAAFRLRPQPGQLPA